MENKIKLPIVVSSILFCILFSASYVNLEQNIYFWDSSGYWHAWENFISLFKQSPLKAMHELIASIRHQDYNLLPIAIPGIFSFCILPGIPSRIAYIISIACIYFVPVVLLFQLPFSFFRKNRNLCSRLFLIIVPLTYAAFWAPTLRGYPDICGLIFIISSIIFSLKHDMSLKIDFKKSIMLGFFLIMPFLLRRWYAYTIITLYISIPLFNYFIFNELKYSKRKIFVAGSNFFIAALVSVFISLLMQGPLLRKIIGTNYSVIYSAYQLPFWNSVVNLFRGVGLYIIPFFILGIISASLSMKVNRNKFAFMVFCLFNLFMSFLFFTRTQSPGMQHELPFSMWILFVSCLGIDDIFNKIRSKVALATSVAILSVCAFYVQASTFFADNDRDAFWGSVMPFKELPLHVDNFSAYQSLIRDMAGLTHDGSNITILSSSGILNEEMIDSLSNHDLLRHIAFTSQVDLRDKIKGLPYLSHYFIVTNPVQMHLRESGQRVIAIPSHQILEGYGIGKAFVRLPLEYKLSNGVTAYVYEKKRGFTSEEIKIFFDEFYKYYPEWRRLYDKPLVKAYFSAYDIKLGDKWGQFELSEDGSILAHPGNNMPTDGMWVLNGIDRISVASINTSCNTSDKIFVNFDKNNTEGNRVSIKKGEILDISVQYLNAYPSHFSIAKDVSSDCDAIRLYLQ